MGPLSQDPILHTQFQVSRGEILRNSSNLTNSEMVYQLKNAEAKLILVHPDLIQTALAAASKAGIPKSRLYLFSDQQHYSIDGVQDWRTIIGTEQEGKNWEWRKLSPEESVTQTATVNFSSGYGLIFYIT
jgi:4-coumarate--CoA ligase